MGIRKMNLKMEDGRLLIMKSKIKKAINRLWSRDISGIKITLHFIVMKLLHHNTIIDFIDILVDVLEGLDRDTAFNIDWVGRQRGCHDDDRPQMSPPRM
jgi:hypothetical protein